MTNNENPPPPPTAIIEPFLEPLDTSGNYILPTTQYIANAAILVVFAYLIPLIVMEVNYFRYAVWRSHGRLVRKKDVVAIEGDVASKVEGGVEGGEGVKAGSVVAKKKKEGSSSSSGKSDEENQRAIVMQNLTSSVSSDDISAVAEENKHDNDRKNGHQGGEELRVEKINSYYNTIIQEKKNNDDDNNDDDRNQSQTKNDNNNNNNHLLQDTSRHSAVGHLMHDVRSMSVRSTIVVPDVISRRNSRRLSNTSINNKHTKSNKHDINQTTTDQQHQQQQLLLHNAYKCIQSSSLISIILSLLIYTISATLIALYTRNMESKMVAVVTGSSKFVAAVIVFILSAKFPQWVSIIFVILLLFVLLFV